uniref:VWFA domain-containing protein n=1 Tax=Setaria digitata TaxID=48799 RepID=A0A915PJX0_9BILA
MLSPLAYSLVVLLLLTTITLVSAIDYEDNDLAKVCRPLDRQLDLLFILDGSGSVSGSTFKTQMAMLNKIVDMIEIGPKNTQIAVMQYSSYTRNKESLRAALQKIRHISGTTKTGKALDKALHVFRHDASFGSRLNHDDVAQVAVVVTDGHSHDDPVPAALRLRQAGVQILALGIGAHINMGELLEITGDENFAFQNLTSQASLDQFVHQFKKIAVGEHCDFSRGPYGAEINCHSDSVEIIVSTVNPFHGHFYVPGQFHRPECVATARNSTSKEIRLSVDLISCNTQKQMKQNLMGALFETTVVLKFHPLYNTKADRVFKVQCFYPEKAPKVSRKYAESRVSISSDSSELRMPCSYKIISNSKANDKCKLEDVRVGEQIIHSWECDKDSFDTYQSMLVHNCVIIDLSSGVNKTVIDSTGCALDSSVMESPEYIEPLSVFAIGKAVKFPDSSMIKMHCHLRFCDRLLGECETILPPRCRRTRRAAQKNNENINSFTTPLKELNRSWDFAASSDNDDEYEEGNEDLITFPITTETTTLLTTTQTTVPLLTFHSSHLDKLMPLRRHSAMEESVTVSGSHSLRSLPVVLTSSSLDTASYPIRKLISGEEVPFVLSSPRTVLTNDRSPNAHPRVIGFPVGGMDVKINTQNVAIVSDDHLKQQYQKELKEQKMKSITRNTSRLPIPAVVLEKTTTPTNMFNKVIKGTGRTLNKPRHGISRIEATEKLTSLSESEKRNTFTDNSFREIAKPTSRVHVESEESVDESLEEVEPVIQLEQRILNTVRSDATTVESQVINVRDLEAMSDPNFKEKWCKK